MSEATHNGSCHCKETRFTASGAKGFEFLCYCLDCRKLHGGGHLSGVSFEKHSFKVTGSPTTYAYPGGSGKDIHTAFCSKCGTPLFAFLDAHPEVVIVRANALEDETLFEPKKSLFPQNAFPWDKPR